MTEDKSGIFSIERDDSTDDHGSKHNVKDSVFTHMFREEKYQRWLCHDLYGDSVRNIEFITADWIFCNGLYNDLGLLVDGRLIVMVEAQSTWTVNICLRMLVYLAQTYVRYVRTHGIRWYSRTKADIPAPDLYVIFTGPWDNIPDTISLKDELLGGRGDVDLIVKILKPTSKNNILWQYTEFCRTFDNYRKTMPRSEALKKAIEQCMEYGVLTDYLTEHSTEVISMMDYFFNQEIANELRYEDGKEDTARSMLADGVAVGFIAKHTKLSVEHIKALAASMGIRPEEGSELLN